MIKTFEIKKGHHRSSGHFIRPTVGKFNHDFAIMFDPTCWYDYRKLEHQGINKLIGFSRFIHAEKPFGKIPVVKNFVNSYIVGWRPELSGGIRLYKYWDYRGVEHREQSNVVIPTSVTYSIFFRENVYKGNRIISVSGEDMKDLGFYDVPKILRVGYWLFPYHGGKSPALQDMKIHIDFLK